MASSACNTKKPGNVSGQIADACPACGFKHTDRIPEKIDETVWPVANLSAIAAAAAGGIFFVAWLAS